MSFRARATAVAVTAVAGLFLAPAAMASSGPVQVTGNQLKSALLPTSDFQPGYSVSNEDDSGRSLEHATLFNVASMSCHDFWTLVGTTSGFGETAFAGDQVLNKPGTAAVVEVFDQSVYQFASTHAAASFYGTVSARYRSSCRSASFSDTTGGTLRYTVHSRSEQRVGSHEALLLVEDLSDSKIAGPPVVTWALWTQVNGDVYVVDSQLLNVGSPQPTLSSLTLKLISRVTALR
jgi:hypothetical protein